MIRARSCLWDNAPLVARLNRAQFRPQFECGLETPAIVAELVDALDLGSSAYGVGVRVSPIAPQLEASPTVSALAEGIIARLTRGWPMRERSVMAALMALG